MKLILFTVTFNLFPQFVVCSIFQYVYVQSRIIACFNVRFKLHGIIVGLGRKSSGFEIYIAKNGFLINPCHYFL